MIQVVSITKVILSANTLCFLGYLGGIDGGLFVRYFQTENRSLPDLYVRDSGLYLLPSNVTTEGIVQRACVFGYINARFLSHILNEDGDVDLQTSTRTFVYVLHYRPLNEDPTTYRMVNKPALVYHGTEKGCISELDWRVQRGDKIGVFIPDNCSSWDQLRASTAVDVFSTGFGIELLCPSQINLVVDENHSDRCKYAYYSNVSLMNLVEIQSQQFIREETVLNIEVIIAESKYRFAILL